jgi:hypothetical protein
MQRNLPGEKTPEQSPSLDTDADTHAASSSGPDGSETTASSSGPDATPPKAEPSTMEEAISAAYDAALKETPKLADDSDPEDPDADADAATGEDPDAKPEAKDGDKAPKTTGEEPGADAGPEDLPEPSTEELAAMSVSTRQRVKQLLEQRKAARQELTAIRPDAENYRTLQTFLATNNVKEADAAQTLKSLADLVSGEPKRLQAFLDNALPYVRYALEATGQSIPQDLRGRVDTGELTEDAARELTQLRHGQAAATQQAERARQQAEQVVTAQTRASIQQAVTGWHAQTRQNDPDFDLKSDTMQLVAKDIVAQRGHPKTPAQAVEFANLAYAEASKILRKVQPQKSATRPTPNATVSSNRAPVRAAPQSLQEAIGLAFDAATRGA